MKVKNVEIELSKIHLNLTKFKEMKSFNMTGVTSFQKGKVIWKNTKKKVESGVAFVLIVGCEDNFKKIYKEMEHQEE